MPLSTPAADRLRPAGTDGLAAWWQLVTGDRDEVGSVVETALLRVEGDQSCATDWGPVFDGATMLCVDAPSTPVCGGDSGGPLIVDDSSGPCLVGLTSFSTTDCGLAPTVYSQVGAFGGWIAEVTAGQLPADMVATPIASGYWLASTTGGVYTFGATPYHGPGQGTVLAAAAPADGVGQWLLGDDGRIQAIGGANSYGDGVRPGAVDLVATARANGYWVLIGDGTVHAHGEASQYGWPTDLATRAVGLAQTPSGRGYWVVSEAGQVRAFGDAPELGSKPAGPGPPIVAIAAEPAQQGFWLVDSVGSVYSFGDAAAYGTIRADEADAPISDIVASPTGDGYWLVDQLGGVYAFGDAPFLGSLALDPPESAIIALVPFTNSGVGLPQP